jgi:hypothetical protein
MNETDPRAAERSFYDDTDYAELDLQPADDVSVARRPEPRSTFALRLDGATIDLLRELAERRGTRPTQLARRWLVERLEIEQGGSARPRLEERVAELERRVDRVTGGEASEGPVAEFEAQAAVTRRLLQRVGKQASVELSPEAGIDLVVRSGDRAWVIEFKSAAVDLVPTIEHVASAATRLSARPVLVSPHLTEADAATLSRSSGVLVTPPSGVDELVTEIAAAGSQA